MAQLSLIQTSSSILLQTPLSLLQTPLFYCKLVYPPVSFYCKLLYSIANSSKLLCLYYKCSILLYPLFKFAIPHCTPLPPYPNCKAIRAFFYNPDSTACRPLAIPRQKSISSLAIHACKLLHSILLFLQPGFSLL